MAQTTPLTLDDLHKVGMIDRKTLKTWKATLAEHLNNLETMELRNEESQTLVEQGLGLIALEASEQAVSIFLKAISLFPDNAFAWQLLGDALESSNNAKKAFEVYNRILHKKPDYARILSSIGVMYFKRKRYKNAIREFKHSIEIDSNQFVTWEHLGTTYAEQGKTKDAELAFRRALELAPASGPTWFRMGVLKIKTKKFEEAVEIFNQCLKLEPRNGEAWKNLAYSFFRKRDFVKAYKAGKKAVKCLPDDEDVRSLMKSINRKLS